MPRFDADTSESGLCDQVAQDFQNELLDLWKESVTAQKEATQSYSYKDRNTHTSSTRLGNPEKLDTMMMYENMGELPDFPDDMVTVHTHPASDGYMNAMLSFADLRNFIKMASQTNGFSGFYALTESEGDIILFGAEPTGPQDKYEPAQKEIESIMRHMDALQDQGFTLVRLLEHAYSIATRVSTPCATVVRESEVN
jgi:hypothetical protein